MTVKEWLNRGRLLDQRVNELIVERDETFDIAVKMTGNIQEDKVQTSKRNTSEDHFVKYASYTEEINKKIDELVEIKSEIFSAINGVQDPTLHRLLFLRYIKFYKWEKIEDKMHYSYKHIVHNLHSKALKEIKKVIECNI